MATHNDAEFPETINVRWEHFDEPTLGIFDNPESVLAVGEPTYIAEYRLVRIRRGEAKPEFTEVRNGEK